MSAMNDETDASARSSVVGESLAAPSMTAVVA